jgi:DegV family protein with EDD domain
MGSVRIVTDSACDMPKALLEASAIDVVPLTIRFGTDEYTDGVDLSTAEFWKRCSESTRLPETAAPAPGAFHEAFDRAAADGCDAVVAITLSSKLSGTYQAAVVAAEAMGGSIDVHVVDSAMVTAAQGLLCLEAAEHAERGDDAATIAEHARRRAATAGLVGTLDTLEHLVKGGRVSSARAMLGSLLSVKPILVLRDGEIVEDGRQRTRGRALEHVAARTEAAAPFDWLAVGGGDASDLRVVVDRLRDVETTHPLIETEIGPVVGAHGGPGVVGVCWLARED